MAAQLFAEYGLWVWILAGLVLMILELVVPGVFLVAIGIAAICTGAASIGREAMFGAAMPWQAQIALFLGLSILLVIAGRRYFNNHDRDRHPELNRPAQLLVGQTAILVEPIRNGSGRARIGDSSWPVVGPDLPAGVPVLITSVDHNRLRVEKV